MQTNKTKVCAIGVLPPKNDSSDTKYELLNFCGEQTLLLTDEEMLIMNEEWGPRSLYLNLANNFAQQVIYSIANFGANLYFESIALTNIPTVLLIEIEHQIKVQKLVIEVEDCRPELLKTYHTIFTGFNQLTLIFKAECESEIELEISDSVQIFGAHYSKHVAKPFPLNFIPVVHRDQIEALGLDFLQFEHWEKNYKSSFPNVNRIILRYNGSFVDKLLTVLVNWKLNAELIVRESKAPIVEDALLEAGIIFEKGEVEYGEVTFQMRSDRNIQKKVRKCSMSYEKFLVIILSLFVFDFILFIYRMS